MSNLSKTLCNSFSIVCRLHEGIVHEFSSWIISHTGGLALVQLVYATLIGIDLFSTKDLIKYATVCDLFQRWYKVKCMVPNFVAIYHLLS